LTYEKLYSQCDFLTPTLPVATHECETTRPVEVETPGNTCSRICRVTAGSVNGMTHPEVDARSLLSEPGQQTFGKVRRDAFGP
jgi:hypothetical protein